MATPRHQDPHSRVPWLSVFSEATLVLSAGPVVLFLQRRGLQHVVDECCGGPPSPVQPWPTMGCLWGVF